MCSVTHLSLYEISLVPCNVAIEAPVPLNVDVAITTSTVVVFVASIA